MLAAAAATTAARDAERVAPITSVAAAAERWPHLKSNDEPVELEGVVTSTMPSGAFRLHDGEMGIYATKTAAGQTLTPGDRVRVKGVLRQAGFSPWLTPHHVEKLGRDSFPVAKPASYAVLASGAADSQWVEIEGVVRGVEVTEAKDFVMLDLGMAGGTMRVLVNYEQPEKFRALIDAQVRIRGVAAVTVNKQKHVVEPSFRVPSGNEITLVTPAPADAFAKPLVPVPQVMRASMGRDAGHRIRTRGVVTRRMSERMFFVRDEGVGLKVETATAVTVKPGDVVEIAGFPVMWEGMAVLQQAVTRVVGEQALPAPMPAQIAALRDGTVNSNLVSFEARLVDWAAAGQSVTLVFQAGDQLFKGLLNRPANMRKALPEKNSLVNVTGICVISELEDVWFYQPRSFLVLVADLADLRLVQAPPWWTPERLWWALAITCAVLLAATGWVWALRRQIERKRAVIEQQARHAAALEERSRIARELHDTLEQGLTGLSLQMKAMETDFSDSAHPARARLQSARQMLRQSRALARNAIRELRAEAVPARHEGLVEGLKRVAGGWNQSGALHATLDIVGEARALAARVEDHLLGIGTEAMTNAVKHGRAATIRVELTFRTAEVVLRISDDGVGFDPAQHLEHTSGCFGLLGMRERARELQGELRINSEPGGGTEVMVTVPSEASAAPVAKPARAPEACALPFERGSSTA